MPIGRRLVADAFVKEMGGPNDIRFFLEHVYLEDDILDFRWMSKNRVPVGLLSTAMMRQGKQVGLRRAK